MAVSGYVAPFFLSSSESPRSSDIKPNRGDRKRKDLVWKSDLPSKQWLSTKLWRRTQLSQLVSGDGLGPRDEEVTTATLGLSLEARNLTFLFSLIS